ncbi:MAG TPA: nuclear transport factor 2 family protein [Candidatus Sulfotelmatobacter sp.]|nr:nuclear transport factor 2 family protein [Candidatus Sulfotelmatobacter sp.]
MTTRKWLLVILALCLFCLWALALPALPRFAGHSEDERVIRQLNEECLKAHDIGDLSTLDRIEDADFTLSGDFGIVSKQQHLERLRKRTGKPEVITRKIDSQQFRFYDGIALVTETDRPTTADGTFAFQSTEVWVHRNDSWMLLHLHYSRLEQSQ